MIDLNYISGFFAAPLRENPSAKHIVKEYIQLMVLDYLSSTPYIRKLAFIGGTNRFVGACAVSRCVKYDL